MRISAQVTAVTLLVAMFVSGCILQSSSLQVPAKSKLLAKMERSDCPGACPVFSLTVFFDGSATYRGEAHTVISGERELSLTRDQLSQIRSAFTRKGFLIMSDQCCECEWRAFYTDHLPGKRPLQVYKPIPRLSKWMEPQPREFGGRNSEDHRSRCVGRSKLDRCKGCLASAQIGNIGLYFGEKMG